MITYRQWLGMKKRVKKKYRLFGGRYYSPKEIRKWYKEWVRRRK